jgi:DNA repair protein RadC
MMKEFNIYRCKLVRENHIAYLGRINKPDDVFEAAKALGFNEHSEEVLGLFTTDVKGNITGYHEVARGDLSTAVVHPREIFKRVLISNSSALILIHNHPS